MQATQRSTPGFLNAHVKLTKIEFTDNNNSGDEQYQPLTDS